MFMAPAAAEASETRHGVQPYTIVPCAALESTLGP